MPSIAEKAARRDMSLYKEAVQKFGRLVTPLLNHIPRSLAFAHILRVNPTLLFNPPQTWDLRKGFLAVTHESAISAGVEWEDVEELDKNAYVWCWDLNTLGPDLHQKNSQVFSTPSEDFWKCVYARHVLGKQAFDVLWSQRQTSLGNQFDALLYAVSEWKKPLGRWPFNKLNRVMGVDLAYTFAVAKLNGSLTSKGFGIRPVLTATRMQQVLI